MTNLCVCGVYLVLPNVFVLDCKHVLCQDCSRIWEKDIPCPRCHIENALDLLPSPEARSSNESIIDRLMQVFCLKAREISGRKQNAFLKGSSSTPLDNLAAVHDNIIQRSTLIENDTAVSGNRIANNNSELKRKRTGSHESSNLADSGEEQPLAVSSNSCKRLKTAADLGTKYSVNNIIKERVLLERIEELKLQLDKGHRDLEIQKKTYKEGLESMKRRCEDVEQKAKQNNREMARDVRKQSDTIKEFSVDIDDKSAKLLAAKKAIQQLKSKAEDDKLALRKAEKRATEYETWGRQTKAYYQDIIRQMETNQPRSEYLRATSPYPREYLTELPSLRAVRPHSDMRDEDENSSTSWTNKSAGVYFDAHGGATVVSTGSTEPLQHP